MSFWDKTVNNQKPLDPPPQVEDFTFDEEAMSEIQEETYDVFEDEEENTSELMADANLRLEQGRLYQMVLQGDIFADTNADPRAIKNVQREIRKYVRERMETMLGIRQEQVAQETIISSPFNDMEVTVLKMLASKMSKGATEATVESGPSLPPPTPKKDGISSISGSLRPQTTPLRREAKPSLKPQPKPSPQAKKQVSKSAINSQEPRLTKPIEDMTPEELAAHDAAALANRSKNYAAMPNNLVPHPSATQLEMLYTQQVTQNPAPGSAVARMTDLINGRNN